MNAKEYFDKEYGEGVVEVFVQAKDYESLYGLMEEYAAKCICEAEKNHGTIKINIPGEPEKTYNLGNPIDCKIVQLMATIGQKYEKGEAFRNELILLKQLEKQKNKTNGN